MLDSDEDTSVVVVPEAASDMKSEEKSKSGGGTSIFDIGDVIGESGIAWGDANSLCKLSG